MFDRAIHKMSPSELLCRAIIKKSMNDYSSRPDVFIFAPGIIMNRKIDNDCNIIKNQYKIYIELKYTAPSFDNSEAIKRYMFFIKISYITDHHFSTKNDILNDSACEIYSFSNFRISLSQSREFIKMFLAYHYWGSILFKTIPLGESATMDTNSFLFPPKYSSFWRWASPKI